MDTLGSLLVTLAVVLFSMILHELAHGLTAYALGDETAREEGRLTLNPFKHLDPVLSLILPLLMAVSGGPIFGGAKPVPINTRNLRGGVWGMALVAVAGPLVNFILAFIGFALMTFVPMNEFWLLVLVEVVSVNLGFGVFNLIPIPPLDGSRVVYALAPDAVRSVMEKIEPFGIMVVLVMVMVLPGVVGQVMSSVASGILQLFAWILGV